MSSRRRKHKREMAAVERLFPHVVAHHYLDSGDFNGLPISDLEAVFEITHEQAIDITRKSIVDELVCITHPGNSSNAHIKASVVGPIKDQLAALEKYGNSTICLYPTESILKELVNESDFTDRPFTLMLCLGQPQLRLLCFDLSVLEFYRNDPRFYYVNTDLDGRIGVTDEYWDNEKMKDHDKVMLKTFGFAIDKELNRAVTVFICYLSRLTPEHQKHWQKYILREDYIPHPDYVRTHLEGKFPERLPIFVAFLEEMKVINNMCVAIDRKPLFRCVFDVHTKPREFTFLIRPTQKEYRGFLQTLDKMVSDNIDISFFLNEVELEVDELRNDGRVKVTQKGSLQVLSDWLDAHFVTEEKQPISEMVSTFREIRKLRQKPAHTIESDQFEPSLLGEQRELMIRAYRGMKTLRLILANFPGADSVKVPKPLRESLIWTY
ncbi:MAG: AAA family ATPase [Candidatus Zixiibacteriota bacterium]